MNKTTINRAVGLFRFSLLCCCPLWYYADPLDRIAVCISQQTDVKLVWWTHTSLYWWRAGGDLSLWCGPESADQQAALYAASALARKAAGPTTCAPPGAETWATGSAQQEDQKGGRHMKEGRGPSTARRPLAAWPMPRSRGSRNQPRNTKSFL